MDINHIQTFVHLYEERNFSRTANSMNLSQPTITMRMHSIERELGLTLITKKGSQFAPTPAGEIVYKHFKRILRTLEYGLESLSGRTKSDYFVSLIGTPLLSTYFLPPLVQHVNLSHNALSVALHVDVHQNVIDTILDGAADAGFIWGDTSHVDLRVTPLYKETFYLCLHPDNPLSYKKMVHLKDLTREAIILFKQGSYATSTIQQLFWENRIEPHVTLYIQDIITVKNLIKQNLGMAFLPYGAIREEVANGEMMIKPIETGQHLQKWVNMITLRDSHYEALAFFRKVLLDYVNSSVITQKDLRPAPRGD